MYRATTSAERPDPCDKPKGCGVTVTDWRLYTADHRDVDGGGNQNVEWSVPPHLPGVSHDN